MAETTHDTGRTGLGGETRLFAARLATALVQGAALYLLYWAAEHGAWPKTQPALFGALVLTAGYAPIVVLAGAGRIGPRTLALWTAVAALALFLLGWHDVARQTLQPHQTAPFLTFPALAFSAAALFIAHHLVVPAVRERRWIVDFHAYFDVAWKAGVQLVLSLGFTGVFWLLLHLGTALFDVIGLRVLGRLVGQEWFSIPVTCLVFAAAVQLTDVRDGLIRGVRTVALMLLSWLLLVITVLAAGFLAALPFTGLEKLWGAGSATALVLSAAAALIVLINTAYQDGRPDNLPPAVLRHAARVAAVLVTPLVALAFWGLALRIGQHGLTPDRIIALACAVVGAVYAGGYLFAAVRPGSWMKPLERTNVAAAVLSVAVILALFSPVADPARLSVADQVARLERGTVSASAFDYDFLRFDSGKVGRAALGRLARSGDAEVARLARAAEQRAVRDFDTPGERRDRARQVRLAPVSGQSLPDGLLAQVDALPDLLAFCRSGDPCVVRRIDLDGDGRDEALAATPYVVIALGQAADGRWRPLGRYSVRCGENRPGRLGEALKAGATTAPATLPDLMTGGLRLEGQPETACDDAG